MEYEEKSDNALAVTALNNVFIKCLSGKMAGPRHWLVGSKITAFLEI